MAKILKKKFFEIDLPLINEKYEALGSSIAELDNRTVKMDITRKLRGKSVNLDFRIKLMDGKAVGFPKKLTLMPFFIRHMIHTGTDYVEDSIEAETKDNKVIIKPFMITRRRVSRAVRKTLRNSAKNWLVDYLKTKTSEEVFAEILSNQLQKPLSLKLKKTYPLAICEIRIFDIKEPLAQPKGEKEIGEIKIHEEVKEGEGFREEKKKIEETIEIKSEEAEEKQKKKSAKKAKENKE